MTDRQLPSSRQKVAPVQGALRKVAPVQGAPFIMPPPGLMSDMAPKSVPLSNIALEPMKINFSHFGGTRSTPSPLTFGHNNEDACGSAVARCLNGEDGEPGEVFQKVGEAEKEAEETVLSCKVPRLVRMAENGNLEGARRILEQGSDPSCQDDCGLTALHCAAKKGLLSMANLLIEMGANPNALTKQGKTPLHYASKHGHAEVVLALLHAGADPKVVSMDDGKDSLQYARSRSHSEVEGILMAC
mmetsp:Transcript_4033/g.11657  ORF Transcript_4033/g.11657 Transcript_4033/m.11657 type:complete len:244 (-) Transcript_4033:11-742(-)